MTMVLIIIMLSPSFREGASAPVMMGLHGFQGVTCMMIWAGV